MGGGSSLSNNPLRTLSSFGPDALRRGDKNSAQVLLFPGGLYINGVQMTTTDRVKVFVAGMNQEVYPISLTAEEMQQIRPDTWPVPFCDSDLWHT